MSFVVAIDGPAGTGKGTITSIIAKKCNLIYLDTGATYRCVTLKLLRESVSFDNIDKIKEILRNIKIEITEEGNILLDGEDVSEEIRSKEVQENVSQVSHILEVRYAMWELQRKMSEGKEVILEGRDIGTSVFPNANVKIYLDASEDIRVERRIKQNKEKGIEMSEEEVRNNIRFRDENDKNAKVGALKQAEDAIYIDNSNLTINKTVRIIKKIVNKKKKDNRKIEAGYVMTIETTRKKAERKIVKVFLASLYHIAFRVKRINNQVLNTDEGLLICSKHVNYLDAAGIVLLNKRYIRFVGKHDLYRIGPLSWLGHLFNIIPVKRDSSDMRSIKMCLKSLKDKEALGIFPEGTRKGVEKNAEVKNGAAFLAYKANVKVIPVGVKGSFKPFTKVVFNYGDPIDVSKYKTDNPDWINNATEEIMNKILELSK